MTRVLIAALVGAIVVFAWQFAAWEVMGLHDVEPEPELAGEEFVVKALQDGKTERGVYWIPGRKLHMDRDGPEFKAWMAKQAEGPRGFLVYDPEGAEVNEGMMYGIGGGITFAIALAVALLLQVGGVRTFVGRFFVCVLLGVVVVLVMDVQNWHWMHYPLDWTRGHSLDHLGAMIVLGLVMGLILRPGRNEKPSFL